LSKSTASSVIIDENMSDINRQINPFNNQQV